MKKQLIVIFSTVLVLFSSISQAQQTAMFGRFMLGITGGLSSPSGNFTKTDYDDPKSGFAGSGSDFGVTGTWFLNKHFGISALVSYHQYSFKGTQNMASGFQDGFDVDSASFTVKGSNHTLNVLIGPYYSIGITDKLSVDIRALVGLTNATLAGNNVWLEDSGNLFNFSQNEATVTTFGMQGGAGLRYNFTSHFGLMLNVDYFYSKPDFSIDNVNRNNVAGRNIPSYNEAIAGISTNLTLVYMLKRK